MKVLYVTTMIVLATIVYTNVIFAQQISIDRISTNEKITGYVSGLEPADRLNYKVVVYVHTDKWYIHPYAGQGEGLSWATIQEDNTWQIETVRREFKADQMAVLLVKRDYPEPSRLENIRRIPHKAIEVKVLQGTPDHGKL